MGLIGGGKEAGGQRCCFPLKKKKKSNNSNKYRTRYLVISELSEIAVNAENINM